jgi:nitrogen fixation/metabolism regulation signal transduction histidine kinase
MARQVAHEIKNPLTPVQLSAEHLLRVHKDRGSPLGSVLDDCVTSILKQVRILRQISSDFSSYGTSPEIHKRPTLLDELVLSVIEPYRHGLSDRIKIRTDLLTSSLQLFIDPVLVGRAFTNIIENALHAMPNTGSLIIKARQKEDLIQITIHDTGVGFDADTRRRIFEPYFSTKVRGTGLGMAIAKRNIELNGGSIAVESIPSVGTTVTVSFPSDP